MNGRTRPVAWTEETVQLKDYGAARQITLFEHGRAVLQVLTSDFGACPAALLGWLKSRWREENFLKYASQNYGIDAICDYFADIEVNTKIMENPARKEANAKVREAEKNLAAAERDLAVLLADPAIAPAVKNDKLIPAAEQRSPPPAASLTRRKRPATRSRRNCPPTRSTRRPRSRCCAPGGAACRWCSGCSPTTPSTGYRPAQRLPARRRRIPRHHPRDHHPRHRRLIAFTPETVTVTLPQPAEPRVARALALLIDQINATPPQIPGDTRPITYQLTTNPAI